MTRTLIAACIAWCAVTSVQVTSVAAGAQDSRPAAPSGNGPHALPAFAASATCLACHNGLTTAAGEDVSIGVSWRASMMANSARDPYWQAAVRREVLDHPDKQAVIEDECSICHMPMTTTLARAAGRHAQLFDLLPTAGTATPERDLAADGVSCTLCHQIGPERLGARESFTGGYVIDAPGPQGTRMQGPFDVDAGRAAMMRSATGVSPAKAEHLRESELCATCHTLFTTAWGPDGRETGTLPEQVPYLEWRHSTVAGERSCQACHMPTTPETAISSVLGQPRDLARHTFLGGNAFMLRMLNRFRSELAVTAPSHELEGAAAATVRQLQADTATLEIVDATRTGSTLDLRVAARNLTGHKLPTGYPSRRVWLHVTVRSGDRLLFESGAVGPSGAIAGNDNDADPQQVEPHYAEIRQPDQVQIYEAVMAGPDGRLTTGLLTATQFVKDNRLLPRGFDKATASRDIAVQGSATGDADFTGAGDVVRYVVPLAAADAAVTVDVELRFQTIGFRWADNLRRYDAPEPRRFVGYYDAMAASSSTVIARATRVIAASAN